MFSTHNSRFQWLIYAIVIYVEIFEVQSLSSASVDICKQSLSNMVFQMCAADLFSFGDSKPSVSRLRGKRASLFLTEERLGRLVKKCCSNPCSFSELLEYCPENWWNGKKINTCDFEYWSVGDFGADYGRQGERHLVWSELTASGAFKDLKPTTWSRLCDLISLKKSLVYIYCTS